MNDRRQALLSKFRASALERLRRVVLTLGDGGEAHPTRLQELRRELHTLKGESTMLGLSLMADVVHAAEGPLSGQTTPERLVLVREACDSVIHWLQGGAADDGVLVQALEAIRSGKPRQVYAPAPPREQAPANKDPAKGAARKVTRWVQVQAAGIDDLCERASDFEVTFRAIHYRLREICDTRTDGEKALKALLPELDQARASLEEITGSAWALRLVPLESSLVELVSHAREIAAAQGKRVRVAVRAGGAQIERTVLDAIWEPLLHLVRNAVDHGVESAEERGEKGEALVAVEAEAAGASILLSISDDGRGIDTSKVRELLVSRGILTRAVAAAATEAEILDFIFLHGFSTKATVSELSGRGVGLDIVRSSVESIGGTVRVSSEVGKGTRFTLSIPATIAKERALVFQVGPALYALPSRAVASVVSLRDAQVEDGPEGRVLRIGEVAQPLRSMAKVLGPPEPEAEDWAAIVEVGSRRLAFSMSRPIGELSLLRRPIDKLLSWAGAVNGSATLEDGRMVLMLAAAGLVRQSERFGARRS